MPKNTAEAINEIPNPHLADLVGSIRTMLPVVEYVLSPTSTSATTAQVSPI